MIFVAAFEISVMHADIFEDGPVFFEDVFEEFEARMAGQRSERRSRALNKPVLF